MTETRTIPTLSRHAIALAKAAFDRTVNDIGLETLAAMGLKIEDGWTVNFDTGLCERESESQHTPKSLTLAQSV